MSTKRIRSASAKDARAIAEVHVCAWRVGYHGLMPAQVLDGLSVDEREAFWQELLDSDATDARFTLVCQIGRRLSGFCRVGTPSPDADARPQTAQLAALYVDPRDWHQGVGSDLLSAALERLRAERYREVSLWVLEGNERALSLYRRFGFELDGTRSWHQRSRREELRMRATLVA
jgi:ribosomal protein S18 acetylase RimI-like enzyme